MPIQYINTGSSANAGNGDSIRLAFHKVNRNFSLIDNAIGNLEEGGFQAMNISSTLTTLNLVATGTAILNIVQAAGFQGNTNFESITVANYSTLNHVTANDIGITNTATIKVLNVSDTISLGNYQIAQINDYNDFSIIKNDAGGLSVVLLNTNANSNTKFTLQDNIGGGLVVVHDNSTDLTGDFNAGENYIYGLTPTDVLNIGAYSDIKFVASQARYYDPSLPNTPSMVVQSSDGAVHVYTSATFHGDVYGIVGAGANATTDRLTSQDLSKSIVLQNDGTLVPPYQPSNARIGNAKVLKLGEVGFQTVITGPSPTTANFDADRLIIAGQDGLLAGEGGDVYLWAGRSGPDGGVKGGGDIIVEGGDGYNGSPGGNINIQGGNSNGATLGGGGDIRIEAGVSFSSGGHGGDVLIKAGHPENTGTYGIVRIYSGEVGTWTFNETELTSAGHIIPSQDLMYDLGSTSSQWRSLYVGTSTIYLGGTALSVAGGNITIDGESIQAGGSVSSLTNGANTVSLDNGGLDLTFTSGEKIKTVFGGGIELYRSGDNTIGIYNSGAEIKTFATGGAKHSWTFGTDGTTTFPNNSIKNSLDNSTAITTQRTLTANNTYTNVTDFSTDVDLGGGNIIAGWYQRNASQIEFALFGDSTFQSYLTGLALGRTVIVTYNTSGGTSTLTRTLTQAFISTGQTDPNNPSWGRVSGRIDATLPVGQLGIVSINFPVYSTSTNDWTFGTTGTLTFPDTTVQTTAYPGVLVPANGDNVSGVANLVFYAGTDWYNTSKVGINPVSGFLTIAGTGGAGGIILPNSATISAIDIGIRFISTSNGPGGVAVQENSLTVGIADPAVIAALVANPGSHYIDFNSEVGGATIASISGPQAGTNIYTLTGTWPANATGFPITVTSTDWNPGVTKVDSDSGVIIETVSGSWTFGEDGTLTVPSIITAQTDNQLALTYSRGNGEPIPGYDADVAGLFLDGVGAVIEVTNSGTSHVWSFDPNGITTFPDGTTSTGAVIRAAQSSSYIIQTLGSAEASPSNVLSTFEFGVDGTLTLPEGGVISEGGGLTGAIRLTPAGGANANQALLIYPTATVEGDHIHLTAGGGTTELYLGNDSHYVKLVDGGNVEIQAFSTYSTSSSWTFGTDGRLVNLDGINLTAGGQFNICTIVNAGSGYNTGSALKATTGGSGTGMTVGIGYGLSNQLSNVTVVDPGTGYVDGDVITVSEGTDGTFILTQYNELGNQGNNNFVQSNWTFATDGALTFPDATAQTTAHIQGEQIFTVNTGTTAYTPTAVDFNLLFVTAAVGYSETDPISVTLTNGVPGQRLVIFNGYNLATLTVNPGFFGRDISSGVVAEFIYSGYDGLWMPLYGTNSPT